MECKLANKDNETAQLKVSYARLLKRVKAIKATNTTANKPTQSNSILGLLWGNKHSEEEKQRYENEKGLLCDEISRMIKEIETLKIKDKSIAKEYNEKIDTISKERDEYKFNCKRYEGKIAKKKDKIKNIELKMLQANNDNEKLLNKDILTLKEKDKMIDSLKLNIKEQSDSIAIKNKTIEELSNTNSYLKISINEAANKIAEQGTITNSRKLNKFELICNDVCIADHFAENSNAITAKLKMQNDFIKSLLTNQVSV